jgi:hypothetical protein
MQAEDANKVKVGYSVKVLDHHDVVKFGMITMKGEFFNFGVFLFTDKVQDTFNIRNILEVGKEVKPIF